MDLDGLFHEEHQGDCSCRPRKMHRRTSNRWADDRSDTHRRTWRMKGKRGEDRNSGGVGRRGV